MIFVPDFVVYNQLLNGTESVSISNAPGQFWTKLVLNFNRFIC